MMISASKIKIGLEGELVNRMVSTRRFNLIQLWCEKYKKNILK